jgi:hypothetical protein
METLSFIVHFLFYLLLISPVCLVFHELGHALMILLLTKQKVLFQFGAKGTKSEIRWGRLTVFAYYEPSAILGARYFLEDYAALSVPQVFWITLGGPLASLLLTILCGTLWLTTSAPDPWRALTIFSLIALLNTVLPRRYDKWQGIQGGLPNDALQLMHIFQRKKARNGILRS